MKSRNLVDQRSLAFGQAIAVHLKNNPALIDHARANLARWLTSCSPGVRLTLGEWLGALDEGIDSVVALLQGNDERAIRLRQSNPFAGVLSQDERNKILRQFEAYDKTTT